VTTRSIRPEAIDERSRSNWTKFETRRRRRISGEAIGSAAD
jgi:hypothetical protein